MIEIKNLTVRFEDNLILDDVSCTIEKGKITSIIGKSGIGKSVLMKSVLGLIKTIEGEIYIDNISIKTRDKKELKGVKSKMAMLFQNSALFDSFDVFQNIAFPLIEHNLNIIPPPSPPTPQAIWGGQSENSPPSSPKHTSLGGRKSKMSFEEIREKVREMIALVNLPDIMEMYPADLSGGMRKRVALARAIIQEPEYLIYDEPTTGLDPITAKDIINLIEAIHHKLKMTSIIITHDKDCIKQLSEMMILIDNKKILFKNDIESFKTFENSIAKQFL